jgi:putative membrane protein
MKRTLVLAVDRDDDFGVKGKVSTPVIGIEGCIAAANALGIADPEDSDLNALYAAISTCKDLQEQGADATIALICGNEKVGHKSDLALVSELETVLDEIKPDNVVLIGDGAEDEYIYPIISSRAHVDSVKKVFVKQAPNIEGSLYVLTKMLSERNKRKRFIAPIGALILIVSLFFLIPDLVVFLTNNDLSELPLISRDLIPFIVGLLLLLYAYDFSEKWEKYTHYFKENILARSTMMLMTTLAIGIFIISCIVCYYEVKDTYYDSWMVAVLSFVSMIIWPSMLCLAIYIFGNIIYEYQEAMAIRLSNLFDCFSVASFGMLLTGLIDLALFYIGPMEDPLIGVLEIVTGIFITLISGYFKRQYRKNAISG